MDEARKEWQAAIDEAAKANQPSTSGESENAPGSKSPLPNLQERLQGAGSAIADARKSLTAVDASSSEGLAMFAAASRGAKTSAEDQTAIVDTITIGEGEGDGQSRLDLDTGDEPTTLIVHQSGGSNEAGLPAIRWKGNHPDNVVTIHDGEFGAAVYATEEATIDSLVQHAGLVQMGIVTIGSLTKHGGELIAENANLAGSLRLHA